MDGLEESRRCNVVYVEEQQDGGTMSLSLAVTRQERLHAVKKALQKQELDSTLEDNATRSSHLLPHSSLVRKVSVTLQTAPLS